MVIQMSHRNRRGTLRIGSIIWQIGSPEMISDYQVISRRVILFMRYDCTLVGNFWA